MAVSYVMTFTIMSELNWHFADTNFVTAIKWQSGSFTVALL